MTSRSFSPFYILIVPSEHVLWPCLWIFAKMSPSIPTQGASFPSLPFSIFSDLYSFPSLPEDFRLNILIFREILLVVNYYPSKMLWTRSSWLLDSDPIASPLTPFETILGIQLVNEARLFGFLFPVQPYEKSRLRIKLYSPFDMEHIQISYLSISSTYRHLVFGRIIEHLVDRAGLYGRSKCDNLVFTSVSKLT